MSGRIFRTASVLLAMSIGGFGSAAQAAVILEIDVSNPTAVTFTATGAFSEITADESAFTGITLLDFFTGNTIVLDSPLDSGAIEVPTDGALAPLPYIFAGDYPGGWTLNDLSFYDPFAVFTMSFADNALALGGSATHDLSGMGVLPSAGMLGTLITGEPNASVPLTLGQWQILGAVAVSEPSTLALLGIGLLGFVGVRRGAAAVHRGIRGTSAG